MIKIISFIFIVMFLPLNAFAHSGGTNAEGCHHNRKTGDFHCHNKKIKSPSKEKTNRPSGRGDAPEVSTRKRPGQPNTHRIHKWVDEKGEVHYSNNLNDLPNNGGVPKNSE